MNRLQEIEARLAEIASTIETRAAALTTAEITALETEVTALKEERKGIKDAAERRTNLLNSIANGTTPATVIRAFGGDTVNPESRTYTAESPEYRTAFLKTISGRELSEIEKRAFTHTTANTGVVMPTTMLNNIWDLISGQHSIMGDITVYRTGTVLEIVKHTEVVAGKAAKTAENTANTDEQNTFVKVTLSGNDFSKTVKITYAMSLMAIDALEAYLTNEIATQLGEAMAVDIITTMKGSINTANKITTAAVDLTYKEAASAFGKLKRAKGVTVYVNNSTFYNQIVGMVDTSGKPIFQPNAQNGAMGSFIGGIIKIEDALADKEILVGDPKRVVYNMVQDIIVENQKDISNHTINYSGYARGQGELIDDKSFALLTIKASV